LPILRGGVDWAAMSSGYQVIARKWRPQVFDEVVGQEHVVRTLKNAITRNRIAHAYLFVGPRGTGKTTTARIYAKALNCEHGPTPSPCGTCSACSTITDGRSMDVIEIDGASNNKVDQIRELCDSVRYAPGELRFRVLIIDEVHMLAAGAGASFNALLKTIEEPPPHTKFVFATTEVEKVLATVISRCQRFDLKPISDELIVGRLTQIAEAEGIRVEPAALRAIARLADGGMRDSQSILDQMIAFCGDSIGESDVLEVYGLISAATLGELAAAIAAADHRRLLALVDDFDANGRDLVRVLTDLQIRVREALLDSVRSGGRSKLLGSALTTEALTRLLDTLREGEAGLKFGLSERANFEVTLLKAVENSRARAIDSLIRELSGMADALPDDDSGEKKK
jgi:DNA polymerase-3 subunit gamma/tau